MSTTVTERETPGRPDAMNDEREKWVVMLHDSQGGYDLLDNGREMRGDDAFTKAWQAVEVDRSAVRATLYMACVDIGPRRDADTPQA